MNMVTITEGEYDQLKADSRRYVWACEEGPTYSGACVGAASMSISRGPYIILEPPALNSFSSIICNKAMADSIIDHALATAEERIRASSN